MEQNVPENELPMWVANMDFETAPEIREALMRRVAHGIFGYMVVPDAWREVIVGWWERRHGFVMEEDWLVFTTGVVPAISSDTRKLTTVGENVLAQIPVYNIFLNSIRNNGRNIVENGLLYDGAGYRIGWEDLEEKPSDPQTTLMILCNPHNPTEMTQVRGEPGRIGELCTANYVKIMSDEIHCDPTEPRYGYIPFISVSEACIRNSATYIAPTKIFNLASLQTAAVMVLNEKLYHKMGRVLNANEVVEPNVFAIEAATAAFTKGEGWLDALRVYLTENRKTAHKFLNDRIPEISLVSVHATYLLWLDCCRIIMDASELCRYLRKEIGLYLSAGMAYGGNGREFLRMNAAYPKERFLDGLECLKQDIKAYEKYTTGSY